MALRRQRGSEKQLAVTSPSFRFSARAFSHCSGSLSFLNTTSASGAGMAPARNSQRQAPAMEPPDSSWPRKMPTSAAIMLPTAEKACTMPRA